MQIRPPILFCALALCAGCSVRPPTFDHAAMVPANSGGATCEFRLAAPKGTDEIALPQSNPLYAASPADTIETLDLFDLGLYGKFGRVMLGMALLNFSAPSLTAGADIPKVGLLSGSVAYSFFDQDFFPAIQLSHPVNGWLGVTYSLFRDAYSGYVGWDDPDFSKASRAFYFHSIGLYAEIPARATSHYFMSPSVAYESRMNTWRFAMAFGVATTNPLAFAAKAESR